MATRPARSASPSSDSDALAVASTFDVLAACLTSGMAVSSAAAAAAPSAPRRLAEVLRRAADMLALGADPAAAWSNSNLPLDDHGEALL
ncbi:MAG: type II secretion system F family protein, partial [Mycobacterium sp.]